MKKPQGIVLLMSFPVLLAVGAYAASAVGGRDKRPANAVDQLKQLVAAQQEKLESLESRVAKLEETHRILRFDEYVKAAKAAEAMGPVQPSGKPVSADTVLKPGDRVLVEWGDSWWKGRILEVLSDARIKMHYEGWDASWDEAVPRRRLRVPATR